MPVGMTRVPAANAGSEPHSLERCTSSNSGSHPRYRGASQLDDARTGGAIVSCLDPPIGNLDENSRGIPPTLVIHYANVQKSETTSIFSQ
jgi:hypothetical protein